MKTSARNHSKNPLHQPRRGRQGSKSRSVGDLRFQSIAAAPRAAPLSRQSNVLPSELSSQRFQLPAAAARGGKARTVGVSVDSHNLPGKTLSLPFLRSFHLGLLTALSKNKIKITTTSQTNEKSYS